MGGVALLACWISLPIAGTSLMLTDPYVTARSFSTPLVLLAVAWALDFARGRRAGGVLAAGALLMAAVVHPLMAGYGLAAVAVVVCVAAKDARVRRWGPTGCLLAVALLGAGVLQAGAPAEDVNYVWVEMTRYYWFPFRWEWYEQVGLVAPLAVLWWLGRRGDALARAGLVLGGNCAGGGSGVLPGQGWGPHLVASMQPLRCFQMVYELMILLLGAWAGERLLRGRAWRWAVMLVGFGGLMFFVQRQTYPASAHLELPGRAPRNPWVQAFVWARGHTPQDALFALDAHYITRDGEDAQTFRAIAERSAVADYSKDGGEASITPGLTEAWVRGSGGADGARPGGRCGAAAEAGGVGGAGGWCWSEGA